MEIGYQVNLKTSSKPLMAVTSVLEDKKTVVCHWIDKETDTLKTQEFKSHVLIHTGKIITDESLKLEIGKIVNIKIGSSTINVVIETINNDDTVTCQWFSKNPQILQTETVHKILLAPTPPMTTSHSGPKLSYGH